jgi:predicted dehydrogenase
MNTRRNFIGTAAAALPAAKSLLAARPGASRVIGANDRINIGIIGVGTRGGGHARQLKKMADADGKIQVVAASEIYSKRKERAKQLLALTDKDIHHDYKELVNRPDVDAVFVATPDHWHFRMAMDGMLAGKDVYLEKPMTYKLEEAKVLAEHVKSSGRVMQVGSQYASEMQTLKAREVVQQGLLGKILFCQGTYSRNTYHGEWNYTVDPEGTPENIDWKRFLGSAPKRPFSADRYFRFRKYWDYSGGIATDLLYHRLVPFLAIVGPQFPVRVSSNGGIYVQKDREVPDTVMTSIEYSDFSVTMLSSMASDAVNNFFHPVIYGHEAVLELRGGEVVVTPEPLFKKQFKEKTGQDVLHIDAKAPDCYVLHLENFFDSMRSRKKPNLDAEFGYKAMVAIGLGVEAYREQKQMLFDPATERILKNGPKRETFEGDGKNVDETKA